MRDIEVAEESFVNILTFSYSKTTWGDLTELENVKVQGDLLIVDAITSVDDLVGNTIEQRDAIGFLLLKQR